MVAVQEATPHWPAWHSGVQGSAQKFSSGCGIAEAAAACFCSPPSPFGQLPCRRYVVAVVYVLVTVVPITASCYYKGPPAMLD